MLRVLVAEDSATARLLLVSLLSSDPEISVVGQAKNGAEAVTLCASLRPDVVTMDLQMPEVDGLEATRQIVSQTGTPVIIVSSLDPADVSRSMTAFNAGALAVLAKPSGPGTPRFQRDCRELIATVKALSEAKPEATTSSPPPDVPRPAPSDRPMDRPRLEIIGIVSSTGGPIALRALFQGLPTTCGVPILVVQHIAAGFAKAFADWLAGCTDRQVRVAVDGEPVQADVVYVAPDDRHLTVTAGTVALSDAPAADGARPSGSILLASLAKEYGARAAGVLLTGSSVDGVAGLIALRDAGGTVFGQDQASCTTFETPRAALAAGAISKTTPLAEIPRSLANLIAGRSEAQT